MNKVLKCDEYWLYDEPTLDKHLCKFWFTTRQEKDPSKKYKVQSLKSLHYGLNRCLKKWGHLYDITKSDSFIKSQEAFKNAVAELKMEGLGVIIPYKEIKPNGKQKN